MDLLIPKDNEKELLIRAKELNNEVIFLKEFKDKSDIDRYAAPKGLLIKTRKDLNKIRKLKQYVDLVVVISDATEQFNRQAVETKGVDYIFNLEGSTGREHTHYRRGGVNQVIAKLMRDNNIKYGISFSRYLEQRQSITLLGRWLFNSKVFKKYNVPIEVFSLASDVNDIRSKNMLASFQRIIQQGI